MASQGQGRGGAGQGKGKRRQGQAQGQAGQQQPALQVSVNLGTHHSGCSASFVMPHEVSES